MQNESNDEPRFHGLARTKTSIGIEFPPSDEAISAIAKMQREADSHLSDYEKQLLSILSIGLIFALGYVVYLTAFS